MGVPPDRVGVLLEEPDQGGCEGDPQRQQGRDDRELEPKPDGAHRGQRAAASAPAAIGEHDHRTRGTEQD